jgi:EAL domain-containing protein (putative c-di-GMP-specific phosphodiesterase class I)
VVKEAACDGVQGFHLAPPMALGDLVALFAARPDLHSRLVDRATAVRQA